MILLTCWELKYEVQKIVFMTSISSGAPWSSGLTRYHYVETVPRVGGLNPIVPTSFLKNEAKNVSKECKRRMKRKQKMKRRMKTKKCEDEGFWVRIGYEKGRRRFELAACLNGERHLLTEQHGEKIITCCYWSLVLDKPIHMKNDIWTNNK